MHVLFFQCCVHVLWYDNCGEETLWIDGVVYILISYLFFMYFTRIICFSSSDEYLMII